MEFIAALFEWLTWCTAGLAGAIALGTVARSLERALDLEAR